MTCPVCNFEMVPIPEWLAARCPRCGTLGKIKESTMSEQTTKPFTLPEAVNAWLEMLETHADHPFTVIHRKHGDDRPEAQAYPENPEGGICQACHLANTARGLSEALSPSQRTAFTAGIAIGRLIEMHGVPPTVEKWEAGDA